MPEWPYDRLLFHLPLDYIILPNCKETTTNSIKLRFDESSRTSLTGLSAVSGVIHLKKL